MSTIHLHQRTTLTPEQYVRGLTVQGRFCTTKTQSGQLCIAPFQSAIPPH